ncbi:unnamed protein product [Paramecium pentaurelia]|uniref:Peptidase S59 domain-containing protein n=1 Tax=Paramecium pentaurelia TaxID=43138 RepID=A0A8S1YD35_9CILI|nr:unnamed protein product [Paramecium pentaurelia]
MSNTLFQRNGNTNIFQTSQQNSNTWTIPQTQKKRDVQGSYRAKFEQIKIQVVDDKNVLSTSIIFQPQYDKMTMIMIRLEDYYLVRAQQIDDFHISTIQNAIQCKRFNPTLISKVAGQPINIPQFPIQKGTNSIWESNNQTQQQQNIFNTNVSSSLNDNRQQNNFFSSMNNQNNQQQQQQQKQQFGNIFNAPPINNNTNTNNTVNIFSNPRQDQQQQNIFNSNVYNNNKPQSEFNNYQTKDANLPWTQQQQQSGNIFQQNKPQLQIQIPNQLQTNNNDTNQFNNFNNQNNNNNQSINSIFSQPQQQFMNNNIQQPFSQQQQQNSQQQLMFQQQQFQQQQQQQIYPLQIPSQPFQPFQNINTINMLSNDLQMIQYQNQMNPIQFIKQSVDMINNFTTTLNNSIQEMEKLYKLEEEKYLEQEYLINQLEQKKRIERQKKQQEINLLPKKKNDSHNLFRMMPSSSNLNLANSQKSSRISIQQQQSQINCGFTTSRISQKSNKTKREYIIEIYFEESENFITFNEEFNDIKSKIDFKEQILQKIDQMHVFKSDKPAYFEKSEFIIDENNNQDNHQTLSFRILQTYRPILTKKGYYTLPDINQLTINQLKNVEDFTIFNEFGSLRWDSPTNLLYLNLDRIVDIQDSKVEVYDLDQIHEYLKPKINKKLNKSCLITLKVPITINNDNYESELKFLQQKCKEQNIELIEIDQNKQQFIVRVDHFSIYTFVHDENDEQQQQSENSIQQSQQEVNNNKENNLEQEFYEKQQTFFQQVYDLQNLSKQSTNQKILKINQTKRQNIQFVQDFQICVSNKEMNEIEYQICQYFMQEYEIQKEIPIENQFCIKLLQCLFSIRNNNQLQLVPYEKRLLGQRLQYFNILFGNSLIQLQDYIDLIEIYPDQYEFSDLNHIQRPNQFQQGLSLILFFESILESRIKDNIQSSYIEKVIKEIKKNNSLDQTQKQQSILQFLSSQPTQKIQLPIKIDDWISEILQWKVNQSFVQYSQEWWLGLLNLLEQSEIQSTELASLIYFLSSKFNRSLDKIYNYLNKNHDTMSLFLELLIFNQDKANIKIHKRIITNKISFLIDNNENTQFILQILNQFQELFSKSEYQKYKELIFKMQNTLFFVNKFQIIDEQIHLQKLIYQQDFINLGIYILSLKSPIFQEYVQYIFQYTIPILIIFGMNECLQNIIKEIKQKQNIYKLKKREQQILNMSEMFCGTMMFENQVFQNFESKNVFEYQMLQILDEYYFI